MFCGYRGIGLRVSALSLTLVAGCFDQTSGNDYMTDSGTGPGDDGETSGDGDDSGGDDGTGGTSTGDGGTGTTGDVTSETSGSESGGSTGGDTGSTTQGDVVECVADPPLFPELDKQCGSVSECALVFHTVDCCGTDVVWGINEDEVARFDEAEAICDAQYPPCGCAPGPTEAEDGDTAFEPDAFEVECNGGICKSYVP